MPLYYNIDEFGDDTARIAGRQQAVCSKNKPCRWSANPFAGPSLQESFPATHLKASALQTRHAAPAKQKLLFIVAGCREAA